MTKRFLSTSRLSVAVVCLALVGVLAFCGSQLFAGERIVVVGDSITGHSMNLDYGFTHEIRKAFADAGLNDVEFVPLGGSGQSVPSWRGIVANSYKNDQTLDIRGINVKEEFDKGADTLLVHLGMNDASHPALEYSEAGYKVWKEAYLGLIADLRARVPSAKRIILTTATNLTENPTAFKNLAMDRLAELTKETAAEAGCEFIDSRAEFKRHFENARLLDPNIRFTRDFIHPNRYGHQILSWQFLKALGYADVADKYYAEKVSPEIKDFETPGLALFVVDSPVVNRMELRGKVRGASVDEIQVEAPEGLALDKIEKRENGEFSIWLDGYSHAHTAFATVKAGEIKREVKLNAPFFVATGFKAQEFPRPEEFNRELAKTDVDAVALAGENPLDRELKRPDGEPVRWFAFYPTADKDGADNPDSVDFESLPPANRFDAAYVVRFVNSPKAQKATLNLKAEGYSTTAIETIYLNSAEIYFGCLSERHVKSKDSVEVELKEGLNIMVVRCDHNYWQWAASFSFEGEGLTF